MNSESEIHAHSRFSRPRTNPVYNMSTTFTDVFYGFSPHRIITPTIFATLSSTLKTAKREDGAGFSSDEDASADFLSDPAGVSAGTPSSDNGTDFKQSHTQRVTHHLRRAPPFCTLSQIQASDVKMASSISGASPDGGVGAQIS